MTMAVGRVPLPATFLRPIAHRGLHGGVEARVENTAPAFAAAIAENYGIECDLRAAANGVPIVFHDLALDRLVDATGLVSMVTAADLTRLRYRGTTHPILTFAQLLTLVAGRTPLLVEVKGEWVEPDPSFLTAIADAASAYSSAFGGRVALMSFDPAIVAALGCLAPSVPRGLVSGSYGMSTGNDWWSDLLSPRQRLDLRDMTTFDDVGASFAAYDVSALTSPTVQQLRRRGFPVLAWTVRNEADRQAARHLADAPIFEQISI